jgi:S-adenosyl methyltransferase
MSETEVAPPGVDPTIPSPARLYDYYLGGTHNFVVDRVMGDKLQEATQGDLKDAVLANRGFHVRAAAWMARHGIRQFLDIGSGLPTQNNTHETVQAVDPATRVLYVDNDAMVGAYANMLLAGDGTTALVIADLTDPEALLARPRLQQMIDLSAPVGVMMTAVMHFVPDEHDPWGLVARYMAAVAPGSYLALSHGTLDRMDPTAIQTGRDLYARSTANLFMRPRAEIERFFAGLELQPPTPGSAPEVTYVGLWGAEDPDLADTDGSRSIYCGVARKP